jgi:hypothetical protein
MENPVKDFVHHHHHHSRVSRIIMMVIGGVVVASVFALLFGWLVMLLWNWLMPSLFSLTTISYWQGFGIVLLSKLLFGGFHTPAHGHHPQFKHHLAHCADWAPEGDFSKWKYYRQYWTERGKKDFENYLNETRSKAGQGSSDEERR